MKETEKDEKTLFVGIDLGTSKSAIAASNGKKAWVESYVGWPKDFVSSKMLDEEILFGKDAIDNRLSVNLYRPLQNGVIKEGSVKDRESVKKLIQHMVDLVSPSREQKVCAVIGVPSESMKVNKLAIKEAAEDTVDSLMVVPEPFAVAYDMNMISDTMVIDIGAGTVDFCMMHGAIPKDDNLRTILTAGDHIDSQLHSLLEVSHSEASFNLNMVRRFKEEHSFVGKRSSVKVEMPVKGKPMDHDISDGLREACESILPPLVETTVEMIAKCDPEYQEKIRKNIILAGGGSQIDGIADYMVKELNEYGKVNINCVDDPLYIGAKGALALAQEMPKAYWEEI
jgi:rod shape-determining protein MreB